MESMSLRDGIDSTHTTDCRPTEASLPMSEITV